MYDPALAELALDLSRHALAQQESSLNELRSRTGTLLAASSVATSFLGARSLDDGLGALGWLALTAFVVSTAAAAYVLVPKSDLVFALRGSILYEAELSDPGGISETSRRLAYWIESFRDDNSRVIDRLFVAFRVSAAALVLDVILWTLELASQ
ncbi:MAG TPA: hypothetical protein VFR38_00815 [Gaiellaceae bacterium]|nr:hypothetical protein [Gaiellaceae bacterium]